MHDNHSLKTRNQLTVGLYFGSYNPIHIGHLAIANYLVEFAPIHQLWFVVSPQNPFKNKEDLLDDAGRLELVVRAIDGDSRLHASSIEFSMPKPSYTIDTLNRLKSQFSHYRFVIIMGSDNLHKLHKWKNYTEIIHNFDLMVYPRPGHGTVKLPDGKNCTLLEEAPLMEISSSFIRQAIKRGKDVRHFVPQKAWEYLCQMDFYKK